MTDGVGNAHGLIFGMEGNDSLQGHDGTDMLYGGADDDLVAGGGGDDWLFGDRGNDVLDGGEGNDVLAGGGDGDVLTGGVGLDQLIGGDGADVFVFLGVGDASGGADTISDFVHGADRIDLSALGIAAVAGAGRLTGVPMQLAWLANGDGMRVVVDADGDRRADLVIRVEGLGALGADDFIL